MAALNEEVEVEIHGDVLEVILSHVPLIHLVSASHVSKWWRSAVASSLRHRNPPKPWLIRHTQATRFPHATTTRAYDPRSNIWINISRPSIKYISALRSSQSNFLYMLSPSNFAFSFDPWGSDWRTVDPPRVWRTDPIVARVGDCIVIAGGVCYFEDDPLAVEIYDVVARAWRTCESMPGSFKDSAASPWVSAAVAAGKLVVTHKQSGLTHWFDPRTGSWSEPLVLDPGQPVKSYHIACCNNGLILIGVCGIENVETVKIWGIGELGFSIEEIGEMPSEFVMKLKGSSGNSSVDVRVAGDILYVCEAEEDVVVACEMVAGGGCRWWNVAARGGVIGEMVVYSCCEIGIRELQVPMMMKSWRFELLSEVTRPC